MRAPTLSLFGLLVAAGCVDTVPSPAADGYAWQLPETLPVPRVPVDNPMTADKVELGRHLFHDTRLSRDGSLACASCHRQELAFTDGLATSRGITGEAGRRSAMSLANVAYNSSNTWASHVVRLEEHALIPIVGAAPVELGMHGAEAELVARLGDEPIYASMFARAFADDPDGSTDAITLENLARALASFQRTILSGRSPFDRFLTGDRGALSPAAERGLALFESERLGCARCHGGFNLASAFDHAAMPAGGQLQFFNTGLYDVDGRGGYPAHDRGLVEVTGDPAHEGRFRAPTLRNIAITAPYMHDGSVATLEDVVAIYEAGGRGPGVTSPRKSPLVTGFTLSATERADLLAFLASLTDEALLTDPAFASPW